MAAVISKTLTRKLLVEEAERRGYEISYLPYNGHDGFILSLSDGNKQCWFRGVLCNANSSIGNIICKNKILTLEYAESLGYKVPAFVEYSDLKSAVIFMREHGPIVVKPLDGMRSRGVTVGVHSEEEIMNAVEKARMHSKGGRIVLQQALRGNLYRLLVIGDRLFGAIRREPPYITGDGMHTVAELIGLANLSPDRSTEDDSTLRPISTDVASEYLAERMQAILPEGETLEVTPVPLVSQGAQTYDVTDEVHPSYAEDLIKFTRKLNLAACGFDMIALDISQPMDDFLPILEANSMPSFGMNYAVTHGEQRNAAPEFLDYIFNK